MNRSKVTPFRYTALAATGLETLIRAAPGVGKRVVFEKALVSDIAGGFTPNPISFNWGALSALNYAAVTIVNAVGNRVVEPGDELTNEVGPENTALRWSSAFPAYVVVWGYVEDMPPGDPTA